jgi:hypothetical protein
MRPSIHGLNMVDEDASRSALAAPESAAGAVPSERDRVSGPGREPELRLLVVWVPIVLSSEGRGAGVHGLRPTEHRQRSELRLTKPDEERAELRPL